MSQLTDGEQLAALLRMSPRQWAQYSPLQPVSYSPFELAGVSLSIKREDLLHQHLSGNKLYKLFGHLRLADAMGATELLSFGGYYSNHLHALAYAGEALGLQTKAIIRGHKPKSLSPTLADCCAHGMILEFVSRLDYADMKRECLNASKQQRLHGETYWIPEGGGTTEGAAGCGAIVEGIKSQRDDDRSLMLCVPVGTGTTAAGLLSQLQPQDSLLGYSALRFGEGLSGIEADIRHLSGNQHSDWQLFDECHFGGFAKIEPPLVEFMADFTRATRILLDPLYTAKTLYSMTQQVRQGRWQQGDHLVMIHTGGLQGRRGFAQLDCEYENNQKNHL